MTILRTNTIAGIGETFGPLLDGDLEFNSQNYIVLPKGSSNQQGVLRTTEDVIGVGGTYYDNLVLAMPFNEATGLRDVSSRNRNPGAYGNVAISTAQSKYYGSSVGFSSATNDHLIFGESDDWTFGSAGDFSIELWAYPNSNLDNHSCLVTNIKDWSTDYENAFGLGINGTTLNWYGSNGLGNLNCSISTNSWSHISVVRSGSTITLYLNGVSQGTTTNNQNFTSKNPLSLGVFLPVANVRRFDGFIQDLRIYKGLAKYTANFTPPERIAEIGVGFKTGALRYNTDSSKVELYDGSQWAEVQSSRPDLNGGARGVFGGGVTPSSNSNTIDFVTISTTGNATDFGDITAARRGITACSSSTRGLFGGGYQSSPTVITFNIIDYITISSTGNAQDFGDLSVARGYFSACASSTRGLFGGGNVTGNTIDYVTISSTGDAKDFGDLTNSRGNLGACSNSTRGVFGGGGVNVIEYVTISSTGNAIDFGDLTTACAGLGACSNSIRGLFGGGYTPTILNVIDTITISSLGNAIKFGDLTVSRFYVSACSSSTRGLFSGGYNAGSKNVIDYVTIMTQGNAVDFGDLTENRHLLSACSNAHGGL
jgi:hypothetical protein